MDFIPHSDLEREQMLRVIGVAELSELFSDVPETLRYPDLELPPALTMQETECALARLGDLNAPIAAQRMFLGAGTYHHYIPPIVADVLSRPSLYSAYTPYQPELSQGNLQATFEYQAMISTLTGMHVSNASHYDGATALAEGVLLALASAAKDARRVVMSANLNPQNRKVVRTYLQGTDVDLVTDGELVFNKGQLLAKIDNNTAALVVQSPGFLGEVADPDQISELAAAIHAVGGMLIVMADPIALGLFRAPGTCGADVVVADGQPLGLPPTFGGPRMGIFATRQANVRRLAGRLVGQTHDERGRRGYLLTLATREQHIRRAKATSNICTNSALGALAAAVYLATVGPGGLRDIAQLCFHKSHYLAEQLNTRLGLRINPQGSAQPWFREFVVDLPCAAHDLNTGLINHAAMIGGLDLGERSLGLMPDASDVWSRRMLLAVTEVHTRADIDDFVTAVGREIDRTKMQPCPYGGTGA